MPLRLIVLVHVLLYLVYFLLAADLLVLHLERHRKSSIYQ